ncbi:hypothetical protein B0F90DRAFT_365788 [Multifurca ochricompacta]|uniref:Uncharacterized protein n=1 Tax=Multifurca ochricompacta TaxID=376703 RepID=A0AAD4QHV3_9AGAM|nr:hypothetical protein B0F90DRAFT_365788 [Multifurca ochricompacta]
MPQQLIGGMPPARQHKALNELVPGTGVIFLIGLAANSPDMQALSGDQAAGVYQLSPSPSVALCLVK